MKREKCPDCGRMNIMYRTRSGSYVCRLCGKVWPKNELVKKRIEPLEHGTATCTESPKDNQKSSPAVTGSVILKRA